MKSNSESRSALVLYGSQTGTSQDVAEELGRLTERLRFSTRVTELDSVSLDELTQHTVVLFSIATTGQGDLPANAQKFWRRLRSARLPPGCLTQMRFASFGLGDSSYPQFNWAHRKLYNRVTQLGAQIVCERGESDEQHPEGLQGTFIHWLEKLRECLLASYPLPVGTEPIPDHVWLPPKWAIDLVQTPPKQIDENQNHCMPSLKSNPLRSDADMNTIPAVVQLNTRLTPQHHWQDVRLLTFLVPPQVDYGPGDVVTVFPKNTCTDVDTFLILMDWVSIADCPVDFIPTTEDMTPKNYQPRPFAAASCTQMTLRTLMTDHLNINAIPRRSFFSAIAHFAKDETQKQRLVEFTQPEFIDELFDYTTRPRRSILEVLQEFDSVKIPLKWICSIIPSIRGRQYSIASGGHLKKGAKNETRIELLVAVVKYRTVIKKVREGLCTRYLAALSPGTQLNVMLSKGGMRIFLDRPAIMVGPGTGVAPLRSLIHERMVLAPIIEHDSRTSQVLFFGCRSRSADLFFRDEWDTLKCDGSLDIFLAFSRDQPSKIYVQDLIRLQSRLVYQLLLQQGVVYVCGSSGKMPQAVREALIEIIQNESDVEYIQAEATMVAMEKSGRYQQETW